MKDFKLILISCMLLIFMIGAVSAADGGNISTDDDLGSVIPDEQVIIGDGEDSNIKEIYVNDTGSDANSGSAQNPYASINKAVSDVDESKNTTIYLSSGTFYVNESSMWHVYYPWGDEEEWEINALPFNFDHRSYGTGLKIIGAGADKTFIDGLSAYYFAKIGTKSNITLKDITFTNFKSNVGGTILCNGNLTVDGCIFKDSYVTGSQGGVIYAEPEVEFVMYDEWDIMEVIPDISVNILNSQFNSYYVNQQSGRGGAIYAQDVARLYLKNNVFNNTRLENINQGAAIYSSSSALYLINNKFINGTGKIDASVYSIPTNQKESIISGNQFINCSNPSDSYSIVYIGYGYTQFENNTFINSSNSVGNIRTDGRLSNLNFEMDDVVINVSNNEINKGVVIPITKITDDMGNIVNTYIFTIKLNGEKENYTHGIGWDNKITFSQVPENGIYNLTILFGKDQTTDVLTTVNISTLNDPIDLYVSPKGSDAHNGTYDYPFETIQHAMDVGFEKSFTVIVHLLNGTYSGEGNVDLTIANKGTLQIVGENYGAAIIDGTGASYFVSVSTTDATFENITFMNAKSTARRAYLINGGTLNNCIIDNNTVTDTDSYVIYQSKLNNLVYTNNYGRMGLSYSLNDSYFANNSFIDINDGGIVVINRADLTIENCRFINNTATFAGVIYSPYSFTSKNNYYVNNRASDEYLNIRSDSANCGVIYATRGDFTFENDIFINNSAIENGVIGITTNSVGASVFYTFTDCKFINNSAQKAGVMCISASELNNCEFINNTADYGGAIVLTLSNKPADSGLLGAQVIPGIIIVSKSLELNDVIFENNVAKFNGNDIYLAPTTRTDKDNYIYALDLTIDFNDLNTSSLVDNLIANVTAPCGAQVGGSIVNFLFDGEKIGSSEIVNGVAILNYAGFEDGQYNLSGSMDCQSANTVVNNAFVNVKLEGILDNATYWVSNDGSDEDGNGSESNPFKSISYAVTQASKNCRNIVINMVEGIYAGDLNTALTLSSMNNLTLVGAGIGKTIIDGENTTYLAKITEGNNKVVISDLTIKNMLPDNRATKVIDAAFPITIEDGANLLLDNVEMADNHGGSVIIMNYGNLAIENSQFRRNGFSTNGIISGGNVTINNSSFEDTFSQTKFMIADNIVINNTEIKNAYILNINRPTFDLINQHSYSMGNILIENSKISNDGSIDELNNLGVTTDGYKVNPAFNVNGNTLMINSSMVNNYTGTLNDDESSVATLIHAAPFGYTYTVDRNVTVFNSTFINFYALYMATTYNVHNFVFDGCLFKDLEYIAHIRTNNPDSNYNITNSVFLNCSNVINQKHFSQMATPQHVNLNDNYWGSNDKPIVYFLANMGIKDDVVEPDTWIILTSEDEQTVIKNLTDGENITDYTGNAPIRTDYADNEGALDYAVVFGPVGYLFTTDDDKNVIFNPEDAMYPFVAADPMDYRTPSVITITGLSGDLNIVAVLVDPVGNPIANATISSIIDGVNVANVTTDDNGTFTVKGIKNGVLTILFNGTVDYFDTEYNLTFADAGKTTKSFINLDAIESDLAVKGRLVDDEGNPIAGAVVTYTLNGENATNVTTDADGVFQVQAASDAVVDIVFAGSEGADPVNTTLTIKGLATLRSATVIEGNNFTQNAIEYGAGERGGNFTVQLKDANGNVLANKTVLIGYNGKTLERVTNATGHASVQINLKDENRLTFAVAFLGDEDYNATMSVYLITIAKKPVTMTAAAKSFKAAAKSKKYSVTLKTVKGASADGKTYFAAGKVVKLSVNGKTYTAKTNAKGQATFNLKLTKKGKFTAKVSYAGDKTYNAVSKSVKLTIN